MEHALACLRKIKQEIVSKKFQEADMWCHIGTAIIREPDEGEKRTEITTNETWTKVEECCKNRKVCFNSPWLYEFSMIDHRSYINPVACRKCLYRGIPVVSSKCCCCL